MDNSDNHMDDIRSLVQSYRDEMIADIRSLVAIKSVQEPAQEGAPFGEGPAKALERVVEMGREAGFESVNLDNYCAWVQAGEGEKVIGILAHVDCVPEGTGWSHDPFAGEIEGNRLYGRGATDDKGPLVAALYAMKAVRELGVPMDKRIRLVAGANEETGMKCVAYYREKEGGFDCGFSPDASFPLIFGEKGNYGCRFWAPLLHSGSVQIVTIEGGTAPNVVCDSVTAVLMGPDSALEAVARDFRAYASGSAEGFEASFTPGSLVLTIKGRAAHASTPELGLNAISMMVLFLAPIVRHPFLTAYENLLAMETNGRSLGVACSDRYGDLTLNVGMVYVKDERIYATIDIRYPITVDFAPYAETLVKAFEKEGVLVEETRLGPSLYVDPASPFIQALSDAYVKETGDTENKPMTIGGGTYSKAFENMVAFGTEFPGENCNIHTVDEFIDLDNLIAATCIYARAIVSLLELP